MGLEILFVFTKVYCIGCIDDGKDGNSFTKNSVDTKIFHKFIDDFLPIIEKDDRILI